jgi:hypothetical protein
MTRLATDFTRTAINPAALLDAVNDPRGVRFAVHCGAESFECLVLTSALRTLDVYGVLHEGLLAVYARHQVRIEDRARRLVGMGLRGVRLVLYPHHFMDS